MEIEIGMLVKWNDTAINDFPVEQREIQLNREFEVIDIINCDMVLIADEYGEAEVFTGELEII